MSIVSYLYLWNNFIFVSSFPYCFSFSTDVQRRLTGLQSQYIAYCQPVECGAFAKMCKMCTFFKSSPNYSIPSKECHVTDAARIQRAPLQCTCDREHCFIILFPPMPTYLNVCFGCVLSDMAQLIALLTKM